MGELKILFFTDAHNSDTPPRRRTESYRDDILRKQEFIISNAKEADVTIIGGDVFHQKKPHKISHYLVNRLMEIYREYGVVYIVPGNHDFDMSPEEINYNPLGALGKLPNIKIVHDDEVLDLPELDIYFYGLGGWDGSEQTLIFSLRKWNDYTTRGFRLAVIHDSVSTVGFPFKTIPFSVVSDYADLFLLGHLHSYQELSDRIVAPGSLSRGVLDEDSVTRTVGYAWISINLTEKKVSVTGRVIPVRPVGEVFKLEEKISEAVSDAKVQEFIAYLQGVNIDLSSVSVEEYEETINKMEIDERVKIKAISILRGL